MKNAYRAAIIGLLAFGITGLFINFMGAGAPANCRTNGEDLWYRFVGADRRDPLYLEYRFARVQPEAGSYVGMGAENRKGDLRRKG